MASFLSVLPFVAAHPDSTTRRDRAEVRSAVDRFSYCWSVTERKDKTTNGIAQRYLLVKLHSAIDMPAFRLHRHDGMIVLSEIDDTGTWLLGQFGTMGDALARLRQAAMARFAGVSASPGPDQVTSRMWSQREVA